ncbi:hypothetical protein HDU67_009674 [Dinochytrium kinnereticum]|nr:hypothetical protein HDU67_009674 [Dinochytrium kinnereticum]
MRLGRATNKAHNATSSNPRYSVDAPKSNMPGPPLEERAGRGGIKESALVDDGEFEGLDASSGKALFQDMVPSFVSKHVKNFCDKLLRDNPETKPGDILKPSVVSSFAAVVMADVSGYSALSATLAERGPVGAEILGKTMKKYLDKIIATIEAHGGDIVKFAGDAVIVCWKVEEEEGDGAWELPRAELVLKASYCCMDLINNLGTYEIDIPNYDTKILRLHLGIGAGTIYDVHVGGEPGRWEHFVTGDAIKQLSHVLDLAKAGELAMSHAALKWVSCVVDIETINIGNYDKRCIIIHGLEHAKRKYPVMEVLFKEKKQEEISLMNIELYKNFINDSALFKLQADINQSRLFRLESNLTSLLELYELRQITTVFMRLEDSITRWDRKDALSHTQSAISIVQTALKKYEGSLRQVHVDDKGAVVLAFFGLPPLAHQNDASHGVKAVLEIRDQFAMLLDDFSIGITTGVVSIGGVGNVSRTEYAVMGDSINMAARLMCLPDASRSILCDEKTYNLCEHEFIFERLGEARIKGKAHPINIFRPAHIRPDVGRMARRGAQKLEPIGRTKEKNAINSALYSCIEEETSGIVIIEADGGQGLSTLLDYAKDDARRQKCYVCTGVATETERSTPYFAFRDIIQDLITLVDESEANEKGILQLNYELLSRLHSEKSLNDDVSNRSKPSSTRETPSSLGSIHIPAGTAAKPRRHSFLTHEVSVEDLPTLARSQTEKNTPSEKAAVQIESGQPIEDYHTPLKPQKLEKSILRNENIESQISRAYRSMTVRKLKGPALSVVSSKDSFPVIFQAKDSLPPVDQSFTNPSYLDVSITNFDKTFEARVNSALGKLREPAHLAGLFDLVMPFELSAVMPSSINQSAAPSSALPTPIGMMNTGASMMAVAPVTEPSTGRQSLQPGKIRMKEFSELVRRIVNALSMTNPLALIFNEAQWMDTLSWELLWEIVNTCPKTAVFIFSRPERSFDNEDRVSLFKKFKRLHRATSLRVEGLSLEETRHMVIATWPGKAIRNVSNSIVENIYRRTNGNPLYIRSLVVAWKDSGQYRIDKDGVLSPQSVEFDFESIVVGYDLKSIVIAHFDRLDRDFQLFLKVSSVLGQRFLLEDVLFFLSDIPGLRDMLGGTTPLIARTIEEMDKYSYLHRVEGDIDGLYFQFKSAVVRNCIYSMMNEGQREQLHLRIAKYYEKMLSQENSHRLLIPLYEHYKETGASHQLKIMQYLEEVCHFYYQKHSMTDAIKHYTLLLEKTREYQNEENIVAYDRNMMSRWNRELGEAYFARADVFEAKFHLCESLRLVQHPFPDNWIILHYRTRREMTMRKRYDVPGSADSNSNLPFKDTLWAKKEGLSSTSLQPFSEVNGKHQAQKSVASLSSERSVWQGRWDNTYVPGPLGERWMESFAALPRIDDAAAKAELSRLVSSTPELAILHNIRLSLMTLAEVNLAMEAMQEFKYAILAGLNISEKFPYDPLFARFLAIAGYMFWLLEYRRGTSLKYLDAADRSDNRSDLSYSTQILAYTARTLFLMGLWDEGMKRYETVLYLNPVAGDISMREESMRMRAILLYHMGPRAMSANVARDMYALSMQEDHWMGKFWGCFLIIQNLLSTINSLEEIHDMRRTFNALWEYAPHSMTQSLQLQTARLCLLTECDFRLGLLQEPIKVAKDLEKLFRQLRPHSWLAAFGFHHMAIAFHSEFITNKMDSNVKWHIDRCLQAGSTYLKKMKGLALAEPLRALNDGILYIMRNKRTRAVRKWKHGLGVKRIEFMQHIQALLHERIAKYSENQEDAEKYLRDAQRIYRKIGATWDCERISLF